MDEEYNKTSTAIYEAAMRAVSLLMCLVLSSSLHSNPGAERGFWIAIGGGFVCGLLWTLTYLYHSRGTVWSRYSRTLVSSVVFGAVLMLSFFGGGGSL